ncbi:MAG: IS21 family transposase [Gammaproteobacteria bacterium]
MIHQIKALYNHGNGLSERQIAKQLKISRNTVSKYLKLPEPAITELLSDTDRVKKLDDYRDYIIQLLQTYPGLSAVKVLRKLKAKVDDLAVSDRSVRRYIQALKQEISFKQTRYYEPVLDMVPGEQCQVDGGELRGVLVGGLETTVYFTVFVLSYSRLMHVSVSARPIDTDTLIRQHDAAFRYFGAQPAECVYDQTKLVVINETFRELELNQRFHHYATTAGFHIRACEGYDPESKGKVEAGVKYVKHNGLYGETFSDWRDLERYLVDWLDHTANQRIHGSTGQSPKILYAHEEQAKMLPYLTPTCVQAPPAAGVTRKADKTGLIAWQSNKYSVPMAYQGARVGVCEQDGKLRISDLSNGEMIAEHSLCLDKGQIIKNTHHYRDMNLRVETLENELQQLLDKPARAMALCALLKASSPKIYKDQLAGAKQVLAEHIRHYGTIPDELLQRLIESPRLTATGLKERLSAYQQHPERITPADVKPTASPSSTVLARYGALNGHSNGQGESHVVH